MTSSFLDRNIVIASVQTDGDHYSSSYRNSTDQPEHRPNGGDLRPGDIWYDTDNKVYYSYDGTEWVSIGGPGVTEKLETEIYDLTQKVAENRLRSDQYDIAHEQIFDELISKIVELEERLSDVEDK